MESFETGTVTGQRAASPIAAAGAQGEPLGIGKSGLATSARKRSFIRSGISLAVDALGVWELVGRYVLTNRLLFAPPF